MRLKAFIIHLQRATERRPQVDRLIRDLPVDTEIVEGVDNRDLDKAAIDACCEHRIHEPPYPFSMSRNEIACFLSHRKAWQAIVDQGLDAGFVIEDDAALTADFPSAFAAAVDYLKAGDIIRFPFRPGRENGEVLFRSSGERIIEPLPVGLGMVAQLISRDAARKLLIATEKFDRPVDTTLQLFWMTGIRPLAIQPGGVEEISARLGGSTIKRKRSALEKLGREILRPLYRRRIAMLSRKFAERGSTASTDPALPPDSTTSR